MSATATKGKGLVIKRIFTAACVTSEGMLDPLDRIEWKRFDSAIKGVEGTVFEMKNIIAPASWSQLAVDIAASKYFRKAGVPDADMGSNPNAGTGAETSVRQLIVRVARAMRLAGERQEYFASPVDAQAFEDEIKFMLATQRMAFNSPVWFNCFSGREQFITREFGAVPLAAVVDQDVTVWTREGWQPAQIKAFGKQPLQRITFAPAFRTPHGWNIGKTNMRVDVEATPDHRWIKEDGSTTTKLGKGDVVLSQCVQHGFHGSEDGADYRCGLQHGVIYGDGTAGYEHKTGATRTYRARLCGSKVVLAAYFERASSPACYEGDALVAVNSSCDLKALPSDGASIDYLRGFLDGWIATDGSERDDSTVRLSTVSPLADHWLRRNAALAGRLLVGHSVEEPKATDMYQRSGPQHTFVLGRGIRAWKVVSVEPLSEEEMVFCAVVPGMHEFTLASGILTGNCGIKEAYSITGEPAGNWCWNAQRGQVEIAQDSYTNPQVSACFILSIADDLMDIARHVEREMRIFKYGSGAGTNFSSLRAAGEKLSNGGTSSGMMDFLAVYDRSAGAIKSGGTTRRAAKMVVVDVDHPDIDAFIEWKAKEEDKARALIAAGYPSDFNGEAYRTIGGQNANNSVRVTDYFMNAALAGGDYETYWRTTKTVAKKKKARETLRKIADATWRCADPGMQYADTINSWHTCADTSEIRASNPCVPGYTLVLTRAGYRRIDSLVGSSVDVWNGVRWSTVEPRVTGRDQPLVRVRLSDGTSLDCTPAHQFILVGGSRVAAGDLEEGEALAKFDMPLVEDGTSFPRAYEHGVYCGDGNEGERGECYVRLYGEKMKLAERLSGKFSGSVVHPGESNENRLFKLDSGLPVKWSVPLDARPDDRLAWFAGLLDSDGTVLHNPNSVMLQVSSVRRDFLRAVRLMLTTLGVRAKVTRGKEAGTSLLPDGRGGMKEYPTQELWRLLINSEDTYRLVCAGMRTYRIDLPKLQPQRDARRFVTVESVQAIGMAQTVYCFTDPLNHSGTFDGIVTGQCSEYVFIDNSACNLASLNLVHFDTPQGFDAVAFEHAARLTFIAQEILVDHASYPTREIALNSHAYRPLGLGYANLGAMLMRRGVAYDSDEGRTTAASITSLMTAVAYDASADMAEIKGPFPKFMDNRDSVVNVMSRHRVASTALSISRVASAAVDVWDRVLVKSRHHGLRNAQATLLAPTGTIGLLMDCDTTGVEPDFALTKEKKLAGGGKFVIVNQSVEPALARLGYSDIQRKEMLGYLTAHHKMEGAPGLREAHLSVFDCATRCGDGTRFIEPMGHVRMMEVVQPFLSGAISKTVNVPASTTVEQIEALYIEGWKRGLKALAIYREDSKGCQVLTSATNKKSGAEARARRRLPKKRRGFTQEAVVGGQKVYVRTGEWEDGALGEIFIDMHKEGATMRSMTNSFAIAISLGLQHGVPLSEFVDAFSFSNFAPNGVVTGHPNIKHASSIIDYVFRVLGMEYLGRMDLVQVKPDEVVAVAAQVMSTAAQAALAAAVAADGKVCSQCGMLATRKNGTCYVCANCGTQTGCA